MLQRTFLMPPYGFYQQRDCPLKGPSFHVQLHHQTEFGDIWQQLWCEKTIHYSQGDENFQHEACHLLHLHLPHHYQHSEILYHLQI
uniref:Uncharacterized protein n=1 Tax=Rhizophora mucronata TaxID=61149 RepID=A0A2P2MQ55_RHIMU